MPIKYDNIHLWDEPVGRPRLYFDGSGDILIYTAAFSKSSPLKLLVFNEGPEGEIGKYYEGSIDELEEPNIVMEFEQTETIDLIIEKLEKIKEELEKGE